MKIKTVGRGQDNNVVVNDDKVSRTHLQMVQDDKGNISVVDLGSANGTYVNGNRIVSETRLKAGDEVRIGNTVLPWQDYFRVTQSRMPSVSPSTPPTPNPRHNLKWVFVAGGVLVLALVVGGALLYMNGKKKSEQLRIERDKEMARVEQLRDFGVSLEDSLKKAYKELEDSLKKANKSMEESEKQFASEKKKVENNLKKDKETAVANAKSEGKNEAEKEKEKAIEAEKKLAEAEKRANAEKETALKKANEDAVEKANQESNRAVKLAESFNKHLDVIKGKKTKLIEVCEELNIKTTSKNKDVLYKAIVKEFNSAKDNEKREDIIAIIKKAK